MKFDFFIGSLAECTSAKQSRQPNPHVNQKLPQHHGTRGSIT
jgi:hypothetical protein